MRDSDLDREFIAFVAGRGTALLRTAYLVMADELVAEERLVDALAETRNEWSGPDGAGSAENSARRHLVATKARPNLLSFLDPAGEEVSDAASRRGPSTESSRLLDDEPPDDEAVDPEPEDPEADDEALLWEAFEELTQAQRAVLVLGLYDALDDEEIAHLVGRSARSTGTEAARALSWLRTLADPPGHPSGRPLADRLRDLLTQRAAGVRASAELAERALARADQLRARRRRRVLAGVAAAAVVAAALLLGQLLGSGSGSSGAARPGGSPSAGATQPSESGAPGVVAVPDAVLDLARSSGALLGYESVVVDGSTQPLTAMVVDADPVTGASEGGTIVRLARAEGGYVVLSRPTQSAAAPETWTLSYLPRTGRAVELGREDYQVSGFAVSPDGLSVARVVYGTADPTGDLGAGQSLIEVQTLAGVVVDQLAIEGQVRPLAVDADRVWFGLDLGSSTRTMVWDRSSGAVSRVGLPRGQVALSVHDAFVSTVKGAGGSACGSLYDANDAKSPHLLWTACNLRSPLTLDPIGSRAASMELSTPGLVVRDSGTGERLGAAAVPANRAVQLAWGPLGTVLLVEVDLGDDQFAVVSVPPPTLETPVIGDTETHRIGPVAVVLGEELPLPG